MYYVKKQTQPKNNTNLILITACIIIATCSLVYAQGQRQQANMAIYAAKNNCTWQANGTYYGDNRDYTCK